MANAQNAPQYFLAIVQPAHDLIRYNQNIIKEK